MRLGVTERELDGVSVISVGGELDLWTAPTLCGRIENAVGAATDGVILDLSHLQFCDSTGLRALAGAAREAQIRRARLLIVAPSRTGAARAFEIAGAAEFLPVAEDVERGLAALAG